MKTGERREFVDYLARVNGLKRHQAERALENYQCYASKERLDKRSFEIYLVNGGSFCVLVGKGRESLLNGLRMTSVEMTSKKYRGHIARLMLSIGGPLRQEQLIEEEGKKRRPRYVNNSRLATI